MNFACLRFRRLLFDGVAISVLCVASSALAQLAPPVARSCGFVASSTTPRTLNPHASTVDDIPTRKTGIQKLLFLRVRYPDDREDPISEGDARQTLDETHALFQQISQGHYGLASTITPVLPLARPRSDYDVPSGFDQLLADARAAGVAAGFDYRDYDLEVVRHSGVPSFAGGNARLGVRGAQVQAGGAVILVHEIGHNLGLSHANFWDTSGPGISSESPPMPSNIRELPDARSIPLNPDSVIGHETITGPGRSLEYGDPWDIMGTGDFEFGASSKAWLGWLPPQSITHATAGRAEFRIHDASVADLSTAPLRLVQIPDARETPLGRRAYAVEVPPLRRYQPATAGVLIRWVDTEANPPQGSQLLDATPGSAEVNSDAALLPGYTFADPDVPLQVTVTASGTNSAGVRYADVVVVRDSAPTNRAPEVSLETNPGQVAPNEPLNLLARVDDADDEDVVLAWDFGDGTKSLSRGKGAHALSHTWTTNADVLVQVTASDFRGGIARAHLAVRVGNPDTRRIRGMVRDDRGAPVVGARVHNGVESHGRPAENLVECVTDAAGRFTLVRLPPGRYTPAAFHRDFRMERQAAIDLTSADSEGLEILAHPLIQVTVDAPAHVAESAGITNLFTFRRTGELTSPLTVSYQVGGSATSGRDYVRPLLDRVTFPAGVATVQLALNLLDDTVGETPETLSVTVVSRSQSAHADDQGNVVFTYYPGWETVGVEGQLTWTRTLPDYLPGNPSTATTILDDDDGVATQQVGITSDGVVAFETPLVEASFLIQRHGDTHASLEVPAEFHGSATAGVDFVTVPEGVHFAAGETFVRVPIRPLADDLAEPVETVELRLLPGSTYGLETDRATIEIRDHPEYLLTLELARPTDGIVRLTLKGPPGAELVLETSADLRSWTPLRTNRLFNTDTATIMLGQRPGPAYYRTWKR